MDAAAREVTKGSDAQRLGVSAHLVLNNTNRLASKASSTSVKRQICASLFLRVDFRLKSSKALLSGRYPRSWRWTLTYSGLKT